VAANSSGLNEIPGGIATHSVHWRRVSSALLVLVGLCLFPWVSVVSAASTQNKLQNESVHVLGRARTPVARWYENVNVALVGSFSESEKRKIDSILDEISLLSGIDYTVINHNIVDASDYVNVLEDSGDYQLSLCDSNDKDLCANFVVVQTDRAVMGRIAKAFPLRPVFLKATESPDDTLCFFSPGIRRYTEIVSSLVYVDSGLDEAMRQTCLQEEIYQSFGLFGDYSDSRYFSFNNVVKPKAITAYDKRLLSSLYDQDFPPGTFAAPVAQQLAEYCEAGGTDC